MRSLAERLFPTAADRADHLNEARRHFVEALVAANPDWKDTIESTIDSLRKANQREVGKQSKSRSRRSTIRTGSFLTELINALAGCRVAFRRRSSDRTEWSTGIAARRLSGLPIKLKKLAADIIKVNNSHGSSPVRYLQEEAKRDSTRKSWFRREAASLAKLPELLQAYSERLGQVWARRRLLQDPGAAGASLALPQFPRYQPAVDAETALLAFLESRTGSPHYREASILLEAVFGMDPQKTRRSREFDAKSVQERRRRRKRDGDFFNLFMNAMFAFGLLGFPQLDESPRSSNPPRRHKPVN